MAVMRCSRLVATPHFAAVNPSMVERATLRADVIAGLSLAGLLLPEAVAYSGLAGLPARAGIVAMLAGLIVYALAGSSRFAIVSATSSSATVLLAATTGLGGSDPALRVALSAGLVMLAGAVLVIAGAARLGGVSNFIAKPVLRGFAFGLAATIVVRQIAKIVEVHPTHGDLPRFAWDLAAAWRSWNLTGLWMAVASLVVLRILARWRMVPGALLVIAAGIGLDVAGVTSAHGVPVVGTISLELLAPSAPDLSSDSWFRLGELAVAMVFILYAESYGSIQTFALRHGDRTTPNRDLIALGLCNVASGVFQGLPAGAGYSATSANESAGAQSRLAGALAAGMVLLVLWTLLPWIERTPEPMLAAVVIHAVSHTLDASVFRPYFAWRRDRTVALAAILAVLLLGVLDGLLVAVAISVGFMLRNLSIPRVAWLGCLRGGHDYVDVDRHPEATSPADVVIARPESPVFFANADRVFALIKARMEAHPQATAVIVSLEESPDLDGTSLEALRDFARYMKQRSGALILARVKDDLRDILRRAALPELPPECFAAWSVDDAMRERPAAAAIDDTG
jgi:MFS superfamily sulfate permease-like transporter